MYEIYIHIITESLKESHLENFFKNKPCENNICHIVTDIYLASIIIIYSQDSAVYSKLMKHLQLHQQFLLASCSGSLWSRNILCIFSLPIADQHQCCGFPTPLETPSFDHCFPSSSYMNR